MAGFFDKLKAFTGFDDDDYDDYDDVVEISTEAEDIDFDNSEYDRGIDSSTSNVVDIKKTNHKKVQSRNIVKVMIYEPKSYDEVTKLIDELKRNKIIVINMLELETNLKTNIFHCMSGAVYALEGSMQKVAKDIFVIAPMNVEVDSRKISEEMENKGFFRW
ncbi:MAG: cell division protein SepF [Andreesenia angusta]|nr:cell division protein SepF [Andreesenia angusta]